MMGVYAIMNAEPRSQIYTEVLILCNCCFHMYNICQGYAIVDIMTTFNSIIILLYVLEIQSIGFEFFIFIFFLSDYSLILVPQC